MKSDKLQAIFEEDIEGLLSKIGMLDIIQRGDSCCFKCGVQITLKNLQLLIPVVDSKFEFVCNESKCIESYYSQGGK